MFEVGYVAGFAWLAGAARIARCAQALVGGRRARTKPAPVQNPVQADVQAALVRMGAPAGAARRAVQTAARTAPPEFEPLFRAALSAHRATN